MSRTGPTRASMSSLENDGQVRNRSERVPGTDDFKAERNPERK